MDQPLFNEEEIKDLFGHQEPKKPSFELPKPKLPDFWAKDNNQTNKPIELEFRPEKNAETVNALPPIPPPPPAGAIKQVDNSFVDLEGFHPSMWQIIWKFIGTFLLIFVLSYSIINGPALIAKMRYFWAIDFRNQNWTGNFNLPVASQESRIIIPKIQLNAPIIWDIGEKDIIKSLEKGTVHYKDTARPGDSGNVFITGHSSYYIWAPGEYKNVFALINKLSAGDKIYVQYNGATFTYEVTNQTVVNPDNVKVLEGTNEKTLSLMTCVPIGTNLQRLVITAKQIPD